MSIEDEDGKKNERQVDGWMYRVVEWCLFVFFFFFKQKTAYEIYQCDWSSDVCSSDLIFRSPVVIFHASTASISASGVP